MARIDFRKNKKTFLKLILISFLFIPYQNYGQAKITIKGTVLDELGHQPIPYATVIVGNPNANANTPFSGTTTLEDGSFSLETDRADLDFYVEVSFIGFVPKRMTEFNPLNGVIDLGSIFLREDMQQLDQVVVTADKSRTEFQLDKRVFNVGSDLSSSGASALEVLNNVPSVRVNIEGQISLRGSQGVQILIDGKPSALANEQGNALGTITADMIEKIEVITNPSAKYNAEGTSGILNIVLKREDRKGINGSVTLNTGVPNNHSIGLSLNKRTEKFNLFSQLGGGYRTFPWEEETQNRDKNSNESIPSKGGGDFNETYINAILGTDYHINERNTITLSGQFAFEGETKTSDVVFSFLDTDQTLVDTYTRNEDVSADNPKFRYELQYKKDFKRHKDQILLFSATGDFFAKDEKNEYIHTSANSSVPQQQTRNDFTLAEYVFKMDYTHPFLEKYTLEAGSQYSMNGVSNDYAIREFMDGHWVVNPDLTNIFDFDQNVLAFYATQAYQAEKWGLKAGLRLENTALGTTLRTTGEQHERNYTDLFPSVHTSYKFTEGFSLQGGYSKRISRPSLWDLNPYYDIGSNYYITTGNPELDPEYTDSYELTGLHNMGRAFVNWSVFHRHTTDVIEDVISYQDNISIARPDNVGTNKTFGLELNAKYTPVSWFTISNDFNYNSFNRKGSYEGTSLDFNGNRWSDMMMAKFKLPKSLDVEVSGNYDSRYLTYQQEMASSYFVNLGMRKKILKGRGVLNLSVRDLFQTRRYRATTDQPSYFLSKETRQGRFVTIGISYGFGKGEAMEFSGQKMF